MKKDLLVSIYFPDFLRKKTFTSKTTNYVSGEGGVFTSYQVKEIQNFPPIDKGMNSPSSPLSADEGHCSFLQSRNTPKRVVVVLMQSPRAFDMCTRTSLIQEAKSWFNAAILISEERILTCGLGGLFGSETN